MRRRNLVGETVCLATVTAVAFSFSVTADRQSGEDMAREIQQAIDVAGADWTAGVTWVSQLSAEEQAALCGDRYEEIPDDVKAPVPARAGPPPTHFNWQDNSGDWTSPIRDQGSCGSCWGFVAGAASFNKPGVVPGSLAAHRSLPLTTRCSLAGRRKAVGTTQAAMAVPRRCHAWPHPSVAVATGNPPGQPVSSFMHPSYECCATCLCQ